MAVQAEDIPKLSKPRIKRQVFLIFLITIAPSLLYLPNAFFALDDYRYLDQTQHIHRLSDFFSFQSVAIENRWDDAWWIEPGARITFLRPLTIMSFYLDRAIWGLNPIGFGLTNVILHLIVTFLVWTLLRSLYEPMVAFLAACLFGAHAVHFSAITYLAGRTDTIAALLALSVVLAHLKMRSVSRVSAHLLFGGLVFGSLLAKECNLLIPPLLVAFDRLAGKELRSQFSKYFTLLVATACYFVLRLGVLGSSTHLPYPYVTTWSDPEFVSHLFLTLRSYVSGLMLGTPILPYHSPLELVDSPLAIYNACLALLCLALVVLSLKRKEHGDKLMVLLGVSFIPLLPLYSSGRFVYLASVGTTALLARCALAFLRRNDLRSKVAFATVVVLGFVSPSIRAFEHFALFPKVYNAEGFLTPRFRADLAETLPANSAQHPIILLNFPGDWLQRQFLPSVARVTTNTDQPIRFVSLAMVYSLNDDAIHFSLLDNRSIKVYRASGLPLYEPPSYVPAQRARVVAPGDHFSVDGVEYRVEKALAGLATEVVVTFSFPLSDTLLVDIAGDRASPRLLPREIPYDDLT